MRAAAIVAVAAAVAAMLAAGCAPLATLRPAAAPLGARTELGLGGALITPRPFVDEPTEGAVQAWLSRRLPRRFVLAGVAAFDEHAAAVGAALSFLPVLTSRGAAGIAVEGGFAWAGVSLPMSLRLIDRVHVYSAPRLGTYGDVWTPALPVGLALPLGRRVDLRVEVGPSWARFDRNQRRVVAGLALAYRYPAGK